MDDTNDFPDLPPALRRYDVPVSPVKYAVHEFCLLFPPMESEDLVVLSDSLRRDGKLRHPIMLFEGKLLDGRHREVACKMAGVSPTYERVQGHTRRSADLRFRGEWDRPEESDQKSDRDGGCAKPPFGHQRVDSGFRRKNGLGSPNERELYAHLPSADSSTKCA